MRSSLPSPLSTRRIVAAAEQHEVVGGEPVEEGAHLRRLLGVDRRRQLVEPGGDAGQALAHRIPVADRGAHIGEHALDALLQCSEVARVGTAVDLQVHDRLEADALALLGALGHAHEAALGVAGDVHHRMDDQVQREPLAGHLHGDRVDQEGHVLPGDLHHGVRTLPAVLVEPRVERAHLAAPLAAGNEMPLAEHGAVEIGDREVLEILGRHLGEEAARERAHPLGLLRGQPGADLLDHRVDLRGQPACFPCLHLQPPACVIGYGGTVCGS